MEATKQTLIRDSQDRVRIELDRYHTFRHGNHVEWTEEDGALCEGTVLRSERNKIIVVPRSYDPFKVRLDRREWQFWLRAPRNQPESARFCLKGRKVQVVLRHA